MPIMPFKELNRFPITTLTYILVIHGIQLLAQINPTTTIAAAIIIITK
jgi:hypothetical protein